MSKTDVLKATAAKYGRSFSTVKRWAATGFDLLDDAAVEIYVRSLDLRAVGASATGAIKRRHENKKKSSPAPVNDDVKKAQELVSTDPGSEGAAAALKRLQEFEFNSSKRLNAAIAEGDAVLISNSTKNHAAIAGALIKFENLVAQSARGSGELISKGEIERAVVALADWIRSSPLSTGYPPRL